MEYYGVDIFLQQLIQKSHFPPPLNSTFYLSPSLIEEKEEEHQQWQQSLISPNGLLKGFKAKTGEMFFRPEF